MSGGRRRGWLLAAAALFAGASLWGCAQPADGPARTLPQEGSVSMEGREEELSLDSEETERETLEIFSDREETAEELPEYYLPQERQAQDGRVRSFLTGQLVEASVGNRRPVAVMMSNDRAALPQYGINRAGVVYEAPVEGGMNRFMAIMEDYDGLGRIGSVRSCRTYYIYFAREFDAVYAHYGQSTFAKPYLDFVDNINGLESIGTTAYYRSSDKKSPHNAYTDGERLNRAIASLGYSQEYDPSYGWHYLFARDGAAISLEDRPGVMEAASAQTGYTLNQAYFVYSAEDGLYHRYQYGDVHRGDEGPVTARNVIFQFCQSGYYASTEYLAFNVHTPEFGYFMTGGKAIPIGWEKEGEFGPTRYYDLNGREVVLNQGQTWVCILSTRDYDKFCIMDKDGVQQGK